MADLTRRSFDVGQVTPVLYGREVGKALLVQIEYYLDRVSAESIVRLDCEGIETMDFTGADACFGALMARLQRHEYGQIYLTFTGVTQSHERLLDIVMQRRKVQAIIDGPFVPRLVGWVPDSMTINWGLLQTEGCLTSRNLADLVPSGNVRITSWQLHTLHQLHLCHRVGQNYPTGGLQYTYSTITEGLDATDRRTGIPAY